MAMGLPYKALVRRGQTECVAPTHGVRAHTHIYIYTHSHPPTHPHPPTHTHAGTHLAVVGEVALRALARILRARVLPRLFCLGAVVARNRAAAAAAALLSLALRHNRVAVAAARLLTAGDAHHLAQATHEVLAQHSRRVLGVVGCGGGLGERLRKGRSRGSGRLGRGQEGGWGWCAFVCGWG